MVVTQDPRAWAILGRTLRDDRDRQGLTRDEVVAKVKAAGGSVTSRTIGNLETGAIVPKKPTKPPSLELVVAALGWQPGWTDRILNGEAPESVLGSRLSGAGLSAREQALELLPAVYRFGQLAIAAGAEPSLRDDYVTAADRLASSIPAVTPANVRDAYGLAAYRPHGVGVPADDAERIKRAAEAGG